MSEPRSDGHPVPPDLASADGVRAALAHVDRTGWDSGPGTALLTYARDRIVRPAVRRAGLRGPSADQAEASGWQAAWDALRALHPQTRSPWGVVTVAVRRAVLGEALAAAYGTGTRTAWRLRALARASGTPPGLRPARAVPLGEELDAVHGLPPEVDPRSLGPTLDAVADAMVGAGWERDDVEAVVDWVVGRLDGRRGRGAGWRTLAARSGLPPWRVRRAAALLLGDGDWQGLVERVARDGAGALDTPDSRAAVRSTVRSSHLAPATAARRAMCDSGRRAS